MGSSAKRRNILIIICILAVEIINQPLLQEGFQRTVRGLFVSYAFIGIVIYWGISAIDSVSEKNSRRVMKLIVAMLIFWLGLRAVKYEVWNDSMNIALWYLFYVPQTLLPLFVYYMTLYIDENSKKRRTQILIIPAFLIVAGILTNNFHQLAFNFGNQPISDDSDYSYGPLYYISFCWMIGFLLAAIIRAAKKSKLQNRSRATKGLLLWLTAPILYILYYFFGPFWGRTYFFNFPDAFCIIYMVFLEICLQSGLLVSNRFHGEIFEKASVMAEITDERDKSFQNTDICIPISDEEKKRIREEVIILKDRFEAHSTDIPGGRVYWLNDICELLRINDELESAADELSDANCILEAEISIKEKEVSLEEQNRIYDHINAALMPKKAKLLTLLEDKKQLGEALVIAAYMKRKANLIIMSRQETETDIREMGLCCNESLSYLRLGGCICNCSLSGKGKVSANIISMLYDAFEEVLEQAYDGVQAMLCNIRMDENILSMRLQLEHKAVDFLNSEKLSTICMDNKIDMEEEKQDETLYLTFTREIV